MTGAPPLRTLAELVRLPAALTVPGDTLAGAAAAGWPFGRRTTAIATGSVCLYCAGMALNDFADRETDSRERPTRPIPSGRVTPALALSLAAGLTATSVGIVLAAGGRCALAIEIPLVASVWAYDLQLKRTAVGPLAMAITRALDVLLGAGLGHRRACAPATLAVGAHTLCVTTLSRHEVEGASASTPALTLAGTAGVVAAVARVAYAGPAPARTLHARIAAVLLVAYVRIFGLAQFAAMRHPSPRQLQQAVSAGILALMPLQATLIAKRGSLPAAAMIAAGWPLAWRLARNVSPT